MNNSTKNRKTTQEKIALFSSLFSGLRAAYGTYDPATGRAWQVKKAVTYNTFLAHLQGKQPYGVYLLVGEKTRAIAADFDDLNTSHPVQFVHTAEHYGLPAYIETSKSKGFHAWIFFEEKGVKAAKARAVVKNILDEIECSDTEIFPKQDSLDSRVSWGSFINAPLFAALVPLGKTVFVDPNTLDPYPDQWTFLDSVERVSETLLDNIIELNDLSILHGATASSTSDTGHGGPSPFGLPVCVQKMLRDGVVRYQRVSCFRLAIHLKRMGLPCDLAVAALKTWALKNKPTNGKGIIRISEIQAQTSYAYEHQYVGYGCKSAAIEPFCEPSCPVFQWMQGKEVVSRMPEPEEKIPSDRSSP